MKPTIGRIVHFTFPSHKIVSFGSEFGQSQTVPAIIVSVHSDTLVNLRVFTDGTGPTVVETSVPLRNESHSELQGFYWEWPPRV